TKTSDRIVAASRQSIGTTVFGGMVAATILSLVFVPVFYAVIEKLRERGGESEPAAGPQHAPHQQEIEPTAEPVRLAQAAE
ncbi:efflux RND transporter permease subunit, partial [Mesorhizobium sp.]|uniref:efflux RND transporter permease subunit n=1 Tax=Mesorhizobium sp. TaxID=1871066 RepID=UPI0025C3495B